MSSGLADKLLLGFGALVMLWDWPGYGKFWRLCSGD